MALIVALVTTLALTPVAARAAVRFGIVDHPGPLKVQNKAVPYLGGAAVLCGLVLPLSLEAPVLTVPLALAAAVGLVDDVARLSPRLRLLLELVIGLVAAVTADLEGLVPVVAGAIAVVGLVNAVNLLDGLDGLAAGVGIFSAVGFAALLDGDAQALALALAGALIGFVVWNRPPARIYLGDAGSYVIGTALAMLLVESLFDGSDLGSASGSLLFVAVPVGDTVIAILRRIRHRRPLFEGDRGHVYDQLVDGGRTALTATLVCITGQAILTASGITVAQLGDGLAVTVTAGLVVLVAVLAVPRFTSPGSWMR